MLRVASVIGVLLAACACPDGRNDVDVIAPRAEYQFQIDTCLADDQACVPLCRAVLALDPDTDVTRCTITAVRDDAVAVRAAWFVPIDCE
jgi:hypothetical protein